MPAPAKPSNPFRVAVRDLPATRTITVPAAFVEAAIKGLTLRDALEGEGVDGDGGVAELELYEDLDGKSVFAQGHIQGKVTVACGRCVAPSTLSFDEPVRVTFVPGAQRANASGVNAVGREAADMPPDRGDKGKDAKAEDEDGEEIEEDDLDVYPFDGEFVDLEPLIREQFVLAVPYAPLCREDCAGLCDQCGANKNLAPCSCARPVDPRFAGLQSLKLPS